MVKFSVNSKFVHILKPESLQSLFHIIMWNTKTYFPLCLNNYIINKLRLSSVEIVNDGAEFFFPKNQFPEKQPKLKLKFKKMLFVPKFNKE
jgi:hypothetical protein